MTVSASRSAVVAGVMALGIFLSEASGVVVGNVCRVRQLKDRCVFSVWSHPEELNERLGAPAEEIDIAALEVWSGEKQPELVWSIEASSSEMVRSITYGEVPEGYHQVYPLQGKPEPLGEGKEYRVTCGGEGRFKVTKQGVVSLPGGRGK